MPPGGRRQFWSVHPPRRRIAIASGAAALALVVVVIVGMVIPASPTRAPPPSEPEPPAGSFRPTPGQWSNLTLATVQDVSFSPEIDSDGEVAPDDDRTTQVFSPFTGHVTRIFVAAGQRVKPGDPLFAVEAAEAAQGQNDLAVALSQLQVAQAVEARQDALFKVDGAALKDLQQSRADLANARANLRAVRERLRILGMSQAQIEGAAHSPGGGAESVVRAPIGGVVMTRQAGVGQYVNSVASGATTPLFTISDLASVWLQANVREADAPALRLGAPLRFRAAAYPDRVFEGPVKYISPVDPNTRRITARAEVANPGGALRPSMFGEATIATGAGHMSPAAPEDAVVYEADTARVWVAAPDSRTVALRQIRTGQTRGGLVEVLAGLRPGERVVNGGALFIDRAANGD